MSTANPVRRWLVTAAVTGGALLGAAGIASAATSTGATAQATASNTAAAETPAAAAPDPSTVTHGPGETLLTGTNAEKVKAAALAAVPVGTIVRVETDSGGATYEAHMTKADGSSVTVKLDASFKVTAVQDGFGSGGPGAAPTNA